MSDPKTERLTLRLTSAQNDLITQAASQAGVILTEFVTAAAKARARCAEAAVLPAELTLHQAAELLNASPRYVRRLLEEGRITHHGESARLRIDRDSLLAYKAHDDQERQAALDELTREAQE